jgi:glycosyltransferase involved in cell wall biosynthesis
MSLRKRILFIMNSLATGGAEKSLVNLLKNFDCNNYQITLLLINPSGQLLNSLNKDIDIISLFECNSLLHRIFNKIYFKSGWHFLERMYVLVKVRKSYDVIISYMEGAPLKFHSYIVNRAEKNFTWVHSDLSLHGCDERFFTRIHQISAYKAMSDIIFVSQTVQNRVVNFFNLIGSFHVLYNIVDIPEEAATHDNPKNNTLTVISIGRLIEVKAFDRVVRVAALAKADGCAVRFIIIGDGPLKNDLEQLARSLNVSDYVEFMGEVTPPYEFMTKADVVLVTSTVEGFPMVVMEAFALNKPVIATKFAAAYEVLNNGEFGMLTEHDDLSIYHSIKFFLNNLEGLKLYQYKSSLGLKYFSKRSTVNELIQIIDSSA